jgi:hypothetical protein
LISSAALCGIMGLAEQHQLVITVDGERIATFAVAAA